MQNSAMWPDHCLEFVVGKLSGFGIDSILDPDDVGWFYWQSFKSCTTDPLCQLNEEVFAPIYAGGGVIVAFLSLDNTAYLQMYCIDLVYGFIM